ncbi:MAG: DNA polymerase III subunit delta', partial [Methylophilaceae bacterium]
MQRKDALPHAILLRGRMGVGKHDFAVNLSKALLCERLDASQQACGECASCKWLNEGTHPDFKRIAPEEDGESLSKKKTSKKSQISVAQIRQLYNYLSLTSHQVDGRRIILISPAETLNIASANALLKILEEPPANTLFLLVASQPQRLLPTIISRCQALDLPIPTKEDAINWLKNQGVSNPEAALEYAGGAPLKAFRMQAQLESNAALIKQLSLGHKLDPFVSAPSFLAIGMEQAVDIIQKWTYDLVNFKLTQHSHYHSQQVSAMQMLCKCVNLEVLLRFQRSLVEVKNAANHPLSNEMQLENI